LTCPAYIREALAAFATCYEAESGYRVPTQCLYPSNGVVVVLVSGGPHQCLVSDEGRAIDEITNHGLFVEQPERVLRQFCTPRGLKYEGAKIFSPAVPLEALPDAIAHVANASSLVAHWGVYNIKLRSRRNLRAELKTLLQIRYQKDSIREELRLTGHSGRQYRFEFVVEIGAEQRLVLDSVRPEPTSINTRAIAHLDIARQENPQILQRMVYDENDDWRAEDLNLLRMAAELVPLTRFGQNLDGLKVKP